MRSLRRIIRRVRHAGVYRLALVVEAAAWLLLLRLSIAALPFRYIALLLLGKCVIPSDIRVRQRLEMPPARADLRRMCAVSWAVSWAISCASRHLPTATVCLHHAIAARIMLRCRSVPTVIYLGACKEGSQAFAAHAWLVAPGYEVTGYPAARQFVTIASFL